MKKIVFFIVLLLSINIVSAQDHEIINKISENGYFINENNILIDEELYNYLHPYMTDEQMNLLPERSIQIFQNNNVLEYESKLETKRFYYDIIGNAFEITDTDFDIEQTRSCTNNNQIACWETNMKLIELFKLSTNDFLLRNTWKSIPNITSYDVLGFRWSGNYTISSYGGYQYVSTQNDPITYSSGNSNFKIDTSGIGLSQNLKDNSTSIENEIYIYGSCTTSGTMYASYQHSTQNISLATSKLYNFSSSGMGGVFAFYGNAVGKYDNTTGVSLSYSC